VVADPGAVRARLEQAGARHGFQGMMSDARYDRDGELLGRDEVLRLREFHHPGGRVETILGWKGPTGVSAEGYKTRAELEYEVTGRTAPAADLLEALGFRRIHTIDRYVEYYHLGTAALRLEWYPRMDVLIEIEGDAAGIEAGLRAVGLPREEFTADPLTVFAARFATRTGTPPVLSAAELAGAPPGWPAR
jgi:adenylate cyclase class IV